MIISDKSHFSLFHFRNGWMCLTFLLLQACVPQQYSKEKVDTEILLNRINTWTIDNPELIQFLNLTEFSEQDITSKAFSLERLYLTSLFYEPQMQVAYYKWQKAKLALDKYDYQQNPELSIPFEYHSDTSNDQSAWTIGAVFSFIYERRGKREARLAFAQLNLLNARLAMIQLAHKKYDNFLQQYYGYVVTKTRLNVIEQEIQLLKALESKLQNNYALGEISQFEISSLNIELQQRVFEQNIQEQLLGEYKDKLLTMTHLSNHEFQNVTLNYVDPIQYTRAIYADTLEVDVELTKLQSALLNTHHALADQLNKYAQSEAALKLEIENQYPDLVLSPGFIFDQSDNIWTLGASWILPIFENSKQSLAIQQKLKDREVKQQEVLALQKNLMDQLYQYYWSVQRHNKTISLADTIVTALEQRTNDLQKQLELGGVSNIVMLRSQIEMYKAKQAQLDIYSKAIESIHEFKHLLHGEHPTIDVEKAVSSWLTVNQNLN